MSYTEFPPLSLFLSLFIRVLTLHLIVSCLCFTTNDDVKESIPTVLLPAVRYRWLHGCKRSSYGLQFMTRRVKVNVAYTFNPFPDTRLFQLSLNSSVCLGREHLFDYLCECVCFQSVFLLFLVMCLAPSGCAERNMLLLKWCAGVGLRLAACSHQRRVGYTTKAGVCHVDRPITLPSKQLIFKHIPSDIYISVSLL